MRCRLRETAASDHEEGRPCGQLQSLVLPSSSCLLVAACCPAAVSLPEANSMDPRQLQKAVALTMAELRKGRVRRLLDWGKLLYRWGSPGVLFE